MNKDNDQLDHLYQQRKKAHLAPNKIKSRILKHHAISDNEKETGANIVWQKYFQQLGLITACLGIFMLGFFQYKALKKPNEINLVSTEIVHHVLNSETANQQEMRSVQYRQASEQYAVSQEIIAIHHSETAVIAATANGWELNICGAGKISISPLLLASLARINALDPNLSNGQFVQVAFNVDGQIITIVEQTPLLEC